MDVARYSYSYVCDVNSSYWDEVYLDVTMSLYFERFMIHRDLFIVVIFTSCFSSLFLGGVFWVYSFLTVMCINFIYA